MQIEATAPGLPFRRYGRTLETAAAYAAPAAAIAAGVAAEWLDFRALRWPLLALVLAGVLLSAQALTRGRTGYAPAAVTVLIGVLTWAAAETLYVAIHAARGESFGFERFDSQPARATALIGVHALFLGAPTGVVAALILRVRALLARPR